ncbi:MAG: ABC transporter ATP-binding protein [Proteobacteria bacterium]|nr:ABC transporter ATP-binding protein [Pseudomonadota bacterium]MBU1744229.1 ABC transporter ATP-binding protein [Pseudomonadota bacterium]MBU1965764.1 ABC transporter ATP-binding protein [Pseudomonadota bacterium]
MAMIEIEGITKRFGGVTAVDNLSLAVDAGEFLTLLGPSGCGKTTVLRMIAGLEVPDAGEIRIAGKTVFSAQRGLFVSPGKRGIGLVFQSYALWPHMSVRQNVAFGLEIRKVDPEEMKREVAEALAYMHLEGMEDRYPQQMSGGQQQRVALARMLVARPGVFLMDEPLSNLDAKLRIEMRAEIKRLHREAHATTVYVTHDQTEALTLSSRVAVMERGRLMQVAPPREIYRRPASIFVADFIGSPTINLIPGKIVRKNEGVFFDGEALSLPAPALAAHIGAEVTAAIRPEEIQIETGENGDAVSGEAYAVLPAGSETIVQIRREGRIFNVRVIGETSFDVGENLCMRFLPEAVSYFHRNGGDRIDTGRE